MFRPLSYKSALKYLHSHSAPFVLAPLILVTMTGAGITEDVVATQSQIQHLGIELQDITVAKKEAVALLPATVVPSMNGRTAVAAPFSGTVVSVSVLPGERVTKGQALLTVASRELLEAKSKLLQAEADLEANQAVAKRYRSLADKKIAAENRAVEAEAQVSHARAMVEAQKHILSLGNIKIDDDGNYTLVATNAGRVVECHFEPGASITAMAPAVVLDTNDTLWVEAQLPATLVGKVRPSDTIEVFSSGATNSAIGKVLSVGHALDPMTRSAKLIGELPPDSGFVSGQLVTISVLRTAKLGGLNVPAKSVVYITGEPNVFVRTKVGFSLQPVTLRGKSTRSATIEGNIKPGQKVATSGLALLENMISKE